MDTSQIHSSTLSSPSCLICSHPTESFEHFLFFYQIKLYGKNSSILVYRKFPTSTFKAHQNTQPTITIPSLLIIDATLDAIWSSHWAFTFREVPFTYIGSTSSIIKIITTNSYQGKNTTCTSAYLFTRLMVI